MSFKIPRIFKVFNNKSFALLWTGQSISLFGLSIYTTCLPFLVFLTGGTAIELSLAQTFFIVPQLIFLLLSGVLVDRWSKKYIIFISDLLRSLAVLIIAILLFTNSIKIYHIYILTGFLGLISTLYRPAVRGILPYIVEKNHLISANSLRVISQQISEMVGPVLGGILVTTIGLYIAYSINAVTFVISAILVSFLPLVETKKNTEIIMNKASFIKEFLEGWNILRAKPWLGASILIASLSNIGIASFDVIILPIYAETIFNGIQSYSLFLSAMAIGAIFCATIIGRLGNLRKRGILYYGFMALTGIFVLILSFIPNIVVALLLLVGIGFSLTAFIIIWDSATQELIDEGLLGRVISFQMFGGLLMLPIAYFIFGFLLDYQGAQISMLIAGASILIVSILGLKNKRIRTLN